MLPIRLYLFIVLLCIAIPSIGQDDQNQNTASSKNHTELKAAKEEIHKLQREVDRLSLQIENQKGHQAKDIAWVNKRVEDFNTDFYFYTFILTAIGIVITVLLIVITSKSNSQAITTAKETATDVAEKKIENHSDELVQKFETSFHEKSDLILTQLDKKAQETSHSLDQYDAQAKKKVNLIDARVRMFDKESFTQSLDSEEIEAAINESAKQASNTPKQWQTFEHCYALLIKCLENENFEKAKQHLLEAKERSITITEKIQTLQAEHKILSNEKKYVLAIKTINKGILLANKNYIESRSRIYVGLLIDKSVTLSSLNKTRHELRQYSKIINLQGNNKELQDLIAHAIYCKAVALEKIKENMDAIKMYNEVIRRFGHDHKYKDYIIMSFFKKGVILKRLQKYEEAIKSFNELLDRYSDDSNHLKINTYMMKAMALKNLNEYSQSINIIDRAIINTRDKNSDKEKLVQLFLLKGSCLMGLEKYEDAMGCLNQVLKITKNQYQFILYRAEAINLKGVIFGNLEEYENALEEYNNIISQYSSIDETQHVVCKAIYNKADILNRCNQQAEAIEQLTELITRFTDHTEPEIIELIEKAKTLLNQLQNPNPETPNSQPNQE